MSWKAGLSLAAALAAAISVNAADPKAALAEAARQVGAEQAMPDAALPVPAKLPDLKVPTSGEGFYPEWKVKTGNPYYEGLLAWCDALLKRKPVAYGPSRPGQPPVFTGIGGSRTDHGTRNESANAKRLFWLCTHPGSRYYMNPEVFRRMLARAFAYANDYNVHAGKYSDHWNDFFAIGPELYALRMIRDTYAAYLLPSQLAAIDACTKKAGAFWLKVYRDGQGRGTYPMGRYCNRDLGVALVLLNAGLYLDNREMLDAAKDLVYAQKKNQYGDGAFAYAGSQNESAGYHGVDVAFLTSYLAVTKDPAVAEILKRVRNCPLIGNGPGGTSELGTAPSWKHAWNGTSFTPRESVAYYSASPFLRKELDDELARGGGSFEPLYIPFYRNDIVPKAKPAEYTVRDRNIDGARARYGLWSMFWTLRRTVDTEPGLDALLGATILEQTAKGYRTDSVLMFARPAVRLGKDAVNLRSWAYLADGLESDRALGRDWSAFGARYNLHVFGSSTKGKVSDFRGTQTFLTVGDRIFGILAVEPLKPAAAFEMTVQLRLGYAGFKNQGVPKDAVTADNKNFAYGKMRLKVLGTNFPGFEIRKNLVRTAEANDLTFFVKPGKDGKFKPGQRSCVAFELAPEHSIVNVKAVKADLSATSLTVATDKFRYALSYDPAANKLTVATDDSAPAWRDFDQLLGAAR